MRQDALIQPGFIELLGMKVTSVTPDKVTAELEARQVHENRFSALHGGMILALADNLGGTAAIANLPEGARTATIESKTNFFSRVDVGDTAYFECTPLHRGRTTMVFQTRVTRGDGKLAALITQTQIVIRPDEK